MEHTIGISEMKVCKGNGDAMITYSLGSCMGLSLYDPNARVGGLLHCLLPLSKIDKEKAARMPCMFTDTGVQELLRAMYGRGASKEHLIAKVAGCAAPLTGQQKFRVGERNLVILKKLLWKNRILIAGEDVGGTQPRTMRLCMASGKTTIKSCGTVFEL